MPNEDRSIEHLIIEIESKTAKATKNMEKLLAITERLNKAIHAGGFEKLNAQMSKLAALDVANATRFGSAIGAATAKAKGLSEGIGAVDTKASNLGKNAEKLTNNITHAVEAAKKLESHLPKAVTGNGNALPPPGIGTPNFGNGKNFYDSPHFEFNPSMEHDGVWYGDFFKNKNAGLGFEPKWWNYSDDELGQASFEDVLKDWKDRQHA